MTSYEDIVSAFDSIIKCKYVLNDELVYQWFLNALAEFELNIENLYYDDITEEFVDPKSSSDVFDNVGNLKKYVVLTLAESMKSYYMQQEVRRVNQLNNVIGKDISLNGTGDTKKYTKAESDSVDFKVEDLYNKQKSPIYT